MLPDDDPVTEIEDAMRHEWEQRQKAKCHHGANARRAADYLKGVSESAEKQAEKDKAEKTGRAIQRAGDKVEALPKNGGK